MSRCRKPYIQSLPDWFSAAFAHLDEFDYQRVVALWQTEPTLRDVAAWLDNYHSPEILHCPLCNSTDVRNVDRSAPTKLHCQSCHRNCSIYRGTPFSGLQQRLHHRLYAVLLTLWGSWRKEDAVWLGACCNKSTWDQYVRRLAPLLHRIGNKSITAAPRYVVGFLPGQLGLRCPQCDSDWLAWGEEAPADNPLIRCEECRGNFLMHSVVKEINVGPHEPILEDRSRDIAVPSWFRSVFANVTPGQYQHLREVWLREPLLREIADELDAQNPRKGHVHECIHCGNHGLSQYKSASVITTYYYCFSCKSKFSEAEGTIFYNIPHHLWTRFYVVLVLLWTSWRQAQGLAICGINSTSGFSKYRNRLRSFINNYRGMQPVTLRPRKMMGFTPAEQGISCIKCDSDNLVMEGVTKFSPDNPLVLCNDCKVRFRLQDWIGAKKT